MIQIEVLSGKTAGSVHVARRFPVRIGRAPGCTLRLEEPGVWDAHATIALDRQHGFSISTEGQALLNINGERADHSALRNGDQIGLGSALLRFWLSEPRQRGLRMREALVWGLLTAVTVGQIGLVVWLG